MYVSICSHTHTHSSGFRNIKLLVVLITQLTDTYLCFSAFASSSLVGFTLPYQPREHFHLLNTTLPHTFILPIECFAFFNQWSLWHLSKLLFLQLLFVCLSLLLNSKCNEGKIQISFIFIPLVSSAVPGTLYIYYKYLSCLIQTNFCHSLALKRPSNLPTAYKKKKTKKIKSLSIEIRPHYYYCFDPPFLLPLIYFSRFSFHPNKKHTFWALVKLNRDHLTLYRTISSFFIEM